MKVLVTGGAGFIGCHTVRRLLTDGHEVAVLDNFSPQIHGPVGSLPFDIAPHVELIQADIRDIASVGKAIQKKNAIIHLAAETGTGQSMYEVVRYQDVNIGGTAVLLQAISDDSNREISTMVVASSRAIYGEGKYQAADGRIVFPNLRTVQALKAGQFEPVDPETGQVVSLLPTSEDSLVHPASFYGLTKQVQEQMVLLWASTLSFSAFALRYQNVFGPGQSLRNPYTGILAIFSNQARKNAPIHLFEDGEESRDFVYIDDVVDATCRCLQPELKGICSLNVGSGQRTTVKQVVSEICDFFQSRSDVSITGAFRQGDIRHSLADNSLALHTLGYQPKTFFREGLKKFLGWAASQEVPNSTYMESLDLMKKKGLFHDHG